MLSANISAQTTDFGYRTKPELSSTSTNSILPMGGQFSVGELGDAEYMIPIEVPQGINGLTPKLGLCYSSLSGSGVCGLGFNTFQYDNIGNLTSETDETDSLNKLATQHKYNGWGQKLETISPDGTISSSVTGWEGQRYFIAEMGTATPWSKTYYDCAGNMVKEESIAFSASYSKPVLETSEYYYNRHGKVYLSRNYLGDNYSTVSCQYDELGRLTQEIDGRDTVSIVYGNRMVEKTVNGITSTTRYDSWDNVKSVTDPMLTTQFQYNSNGNPSLASAGDGRVSITYTQEGLRESITDSDAGQETYEYDSFGRTTKHTNAKGIITANTYENGLLTQTVCGGVATTYALMNDNIVEYSKSGNILYKSDMGAYEYSAPQPHAVTGVEDPNNIIKSLKQEYTYTPFKKPASISGTDLNGKAYSYTIHYGPDNNRIKAIYSKGSDRTTTYYLPGYEVENRNGVVASRHYIYTSKGNLAAINFASGGKNVLMYAVCDFQGSLLRLYDNDFRLKYSASYSPWGVRSVLQNTTGFNIPRGYTMHEHLDEFGLINMNARLYDPYIARFLSPDPYIQDPENSQNFNRYSYCLNNPLKYTDPSGEFWHLVVGGLVGGFSNWISNGCKFSWKGLGYFGVGALSGTISTGIGPGVSSMLGGGTFWAGFWGTELAKTASSSFISGATIGGFSGSFGGSISSLGNNLINGNSWGKSLLCSSKDGLIGGITGGLFGGLYSGIDATINKRDFLTGTEVEYRYYSMKDRDLPIHFQANPDYGCTGETLESFIEYYGDNIIVSPSDLSSGQDLGILARKYGYNTKEFNIHNSKAIIGSHLEQGHCVGMTYQNEEVFHTVGINKVIFRKRYTYLSQTPKYKIIFEIMNPLNRHGYESFTRFDLIKTIKIITQKQ